MVWTKIQDYDTSRDIILSIQNASLIPLSKVYFCLTENNSPTEANTFVLTGPNQWTGRVSQGTNVFVAEEDGGIATHCFSYIEKLVNYNIPTSHNDFDLKTDLTINCPEGSYLTIQNKSKVPVYYTFDGVNSKAGKFVITENQMVSYTWSHDQNVKVYAAPGQDALNGYISYAIGQSPNVTMLSEATQKMLEEMMAKVDMVVKNYATKEELKVVHKRTFMGWWSDFQLVNIANSATIPLPQFVADSVYDSGFVDEDNKIIDFTLSLHLTVPNGVETEEEIATMSLSLITKAQSDDFGVANFYTDNTWLQLNIRGVELQRDTTHKALFLKLLFKEAPVAATVSYAVRTDGCKFVPYTDEFLGLIVTNYDIDKDNTEIHFTNEAFYYGMMELFQYELSPNKITYGLLTKKVQEDTGIKIITYDGASETKAKLTVKEEECILEIHVPTSVAVSKIVGLNLVTKDKGDPVSNVYLDLITMGNGTQIKTSSGGMDTFQIPLWRHSLTKFNYIATPLNKIPNELISKYEMEIVY